MNVIQAALDALSLGGQFALTALGIGLIFGIMRLVNFAHGELIMGGGYALLFLTTLPTPLTAVLSLLVVLMLALGMERGAFRPLRRANLPTLLVASFAVSFLLQNLIILTLGSRPKAINFAPALSQQLELGGLRIPLVQLLMIAATLVLLTAIGLFLKKSRFGIQMRAAAEDLVMARLLGVRANTVIALAFLMSGLLASVVSLLFVAQIGVLSPDMGLRPALIGFVATVVGGLGSLLGAVLGGFLIGIVAVLLQLLLPLDLRPFSEAFLFAILFLVLLVRPQGLIVVRAARERV